MSKYILSFSVQSLLRGQSPTNTRAADVVSLAELQGDDGKRCSARKYYRKGGGVGGAKLMKESDEHRFELLPGRFCRGGRGLGGE